MATVLPYRHLRKDLADPREASALPAGVHLAGFDAARDLADLHGLLAVTYAEAGARFDGLDVWSEWLTGDSEFDARAIFLVRDGAGNLAGACQCWTSAFVKDLAVARKWRGRGIGRALMLRAFDHFRARGAAGVELKVGLSNRTGAQRLYRALGMREIAPY